MSNFDVEMVETATEEMEDGTSHGKATVAQVSGSSKSLDVVPKTYELPWLVQH